MKLDKSILVILLFLLLACIGGVYASDNQTSADVLSIDSSSYVDEIDVDTSSVDENTVAVVADDAAADDNKNIVSANNSTIELGMSDENKESLKMSGELSQDSEENDVLGAPAQRDILGLDLNGGNFASLRNSITSNNNQFTLKGSYTSIDRDYDYRYTYNPVSRDGISISKSITLTGNGVYYIDASSRSRIFQISGTSTVVTFDSVVFRGGGYSNYDGGAITIASGATVNFINCKFESNKAVRGGALDIKSNKVTFTGCFFTLNTATTSAGAVYLSPGGSAKFDGCLFQGNKVTGTGSSQGFGGAITFAKSEGGANYFVGINILNCRFIKNEATAQGGAINFQGYLNDSNIKGCTFDGNTGENGGGAILVLNDTFRCNFTNNTFKKNIVNTRFGGAMFSGILNKCNVTGIFEGNTAYDGGALCFDGCTGSYISAQFKNNKATQGNGGAMNFIDSVNNTDFYRCSFDSDTASNSNGGAVYILEAYGKINFRESNFTNNKATYGGAVYAISKSDDVYVFEDCEFDGCKADNAGAAVYLNDCKGASFTSCKFNANTADKGASIYVDSLSESVAVDRCDFTNNHVTSFAGSGGAGICWDAEGGSLNNSNFINNTADGYGGAVDWNSETEFITSNCTFKDNKAEIGGAVFLRKAIGNLEIYDSSFTNNNADDYGGAISVYVSCNDVKLDGTNFTDNDANNGGAIYVQLASGNVEISNAQFVDNDAEETHGGALYLVSVNGNLILDECNFTGSDACEVGGAIYLDSEINTINISNSNFTKNAAENGDGGAIFMPSCKDLILNRVKFDDNDASQARGGSIYVGGNLVNLDIQQCTFSNCDAGSVKEDGGAAIFIGPNVKGSIICNKSSFTDNSAAGKGGAFFIYSGDNAQKVIVTDSNFTHNSAFYEGGALFIGFRMNNVDINNSRFIGNSITKQTGSGGAAVFIGTDNNIVNLYDDYFKDNSVNGNGAAAYIYGSTNTEYDVNVIRCNFTNNDATGDGGALHLGTDNLNRVGDFNCENCIFTDNDAGKSGGAIYNEFAKAGKEFKIISSNFTDNDAKENGGAIYTTQNSPEIYSSSFNNNHATGNGGALYLTGNDAVINASSFNNNGASNGGAVSSTGSNTQVSYCNFTANSAERKGGSLYLAGDNSKVRKSNFTLSSASQEGGAIYVDSNVAVDVESSAFDTCSGDVAGGAIYANGKLNVRDSSFDSGSAQSGSAIYLNTQGNSIDECDFTDNSASNAGTVFVNAGGTDITNSNFTNNEAGDASGVWLDGDANIVSDNNFTGVKLFYVNGGTSELSNNRELSNVDSNYSLMNWGTVSLSKNVFHNIIENHGTITSATYANVSRNTTYTNNEWYFHASALVFDDNNNSIISYSLNISSDRGHNVPAADNLTHNATLEVSLFIYIIGAKDAGLTNLTVYTSTLTMITKSGSYTWLQEIIDKLADDEILSLTQNVTFNATYDLNPNNPYWIKGTDFTYGMIYNKTGGIEGNGFTISGDNEARIFNITVSDIVINNINFVNGTADNGGAIYVSENLENIIINNSVFTNNRLLASSDTCGGAIFFAHDCSGIIIDRTVFDANEASSGGALQFYAGNDEKFSNIKILNSNFTNNRDNFNDAADTGDGGDWGGSAININRGENVQIVGCNFENNSGLDNGAIFLDYGDNIKILNSNFTQNSAVKGAAVFLYRGNPVLNINDCIFAANDASVIAGAVYISGGTVNIDDNEFINNTAVNTGALYINVGTGQTDIKNVVFKGNNASSQTSALWLQAGADSSLTNCNFTDNQVPEGQYCAYIAAGSGFTLNECDFTDNAVSGEYILLFDSLNGKIVKSSFTNNTAGGNGVVYIAKDSNLVDDCDFTANSANIGGALYSNKDNTTISDSRFNDNNAAAAGAVWLGTQSNIINCSFRNNTAEYAGAVYTASSVKDSKFDDNKATAGDGAAIYVTEDNIIIQNSEFKGNNASGKGGAVYFASRYGNIAYCNFTQNTAAEGGAVYLDAEHSNVLFSRFLKNSALYGGAVFVAKDHTIILESYFDENTAVRDGGAIYIMDSEDVMIKNSTFANSFAYNGGAVYNSGTAGAGVYIYNDTFIRNIASHNGGAVYYVVDNDTARIPVIYRDYMNFDGRGVNDTSNRTSLTMETASSTFTNRIFESYFKDNEDYFYNVATKNIGLSAIITLYVPNDVNRTKTKVIVTITDSEGNKTTKEVVGYITGPGRIEVQFDNLVNGTQYNVTASFEEEGSYIKKELNSTVIIGTLYRGQFIYIQELIDEAIEEVAGTDRIAEMTIPMHITYDPKRDNGQINITAPIIIHGEGRYLDADGYCRIFFINSTGVILENIEFKNADVYGPVSNDKKNGGAILFEAGNATVIDCIFHNNTADNGGAIFVTQTSENITISDSEFYDNHAEYKGGAIVWNATGGILNESNLHENTAGTDGGAVYIAENATSAHIIHSTFSHNEANKTAGHGGAIGWYASSGRLEYTNFNSNEAGYGGAVYIGIKTESSNITHCEFTDNRAAHNGGAVDWNASVGKIVDSRFTANKAEYGGAVFRGANSTGGYSKNNTFILNHATKNGGAVDWNATAGKIYDSFYYNNTADGNGGAIFVGAKTTNGTIVNTVFENNSAKGHGGAVDWFAASGDIEKCRFTHNDADYGGALFLGTLSANSTIKNSTFDGNIAKHNGGAIDCNATKMRLENTVFKNNMAKFGAALCRGANSEGGSGDNNTFIANHAEESGAALGWLGAHSIYINNYKFINNTADVSGGAIYVGPESMGCVINNSYFKGNHIIDNAGDGGAIYSGAVNMSVVSTTFEDNNAHCGGAIYLGSASGNATIIESTFNSNGAVSDGGAISSQASSVAVENSKFNDNYAEDGGAIYVSAAGLTNYIHSSEFNRNNATGGLGGAVNWLASQGHILESNFTENYAKFGGGIYLGDNSASSSISRVIFDGNNASERGGAICWNSTGGDLTHNIFKNNEADYGAALAREANSTNGHGINNTFIANHARVSGAGLAWMNAVGIYINNYSFINNTAGRSGAAIYIHDGSDNCVIFNSTFYGNYLTNMSDKHFGGAVDCHGDNTTISMSSFEYNRAYSGGAIYVASDSGNTHILSSNFTDNRAVNHGGAIGLKAAAVNVSNSNFNDNIAQNGDGGAIYVGGDSNTNNVYRSTFDNNHADNGHGGAVEWVAAAGNIIFSNFTNNEADYGGALHLGGNASESRVLNVLFENNTARTNGGAMDSNATRVQLYNTIFKGNEAQYGAALCREVGATGGSGYNNTFILNFASKGGAALAWMNVSNIVIDHYYFYNNTADIHGGAIFVLDGSDNCQVINCVFEYNKVELSHGGAIDWVGNNGLIVNSTFYKNYAKDAGAIIICDHASNMTVLNSSFVESRATDGSGGAILIYGNGATVSGCDFSSSYAYEKGAAIAGFGAKNATISNNAFNYSTVAGYHESNGVLHGEGGAIYWDNADDLNISDSIFYYNEAHYKGGSIALDNCSNTALYNLSFQRDASNYYGGSISWCNSRNVTVDSCSFDTCRAEQTGGAVYFSNVEGSIINSNFTGARCSWNAGGAVYASGNVTIENSTFRNCAALNMLGTAVLLDGGNSSIITSDFASQNPIRISNNTEAHLTGNHAEGTGSDSWSVYNDGDLYLEKNVFGSVIMNNGTIWTETHTYVLDGKNWTAEWMTYYDFWVNITDDNNNSIVSVDSLISFNNVTSETFKMPYNKRTLQLIYQGVFLVNATDSGLKSNTVHPGILKVKANTAIDFDIDYDEVTQGEKVTIRAYVYEPTRSTPYNITGNVTFTVNGKEYSRKIIDGVATLNLTNLMADTYMVTAVYDGDDLFYGSENDTYFIIKLRKSWITVSVNDIAYGGIAIANATTNANGTVLFYIAGNNKREMIEGNHSYLNIRDFLGDLEPGVWSIGVVYLGNEYYEYAINQTSFEVYKLNTTIEAIPNNISYGKNEIVDVSVNENASGYIALLIDEHTIYVGIINKGSVQFNISGLEAKEYNDVRVYYQGDTYFNFNETYISFTVGPTEEYPMDVRADNITYPENAVIRVLLPTYAGGNVSMWVDGHYVGNVNVSQEGIALLNNVSGLAGGFHTVNVTYHGSTRYAAKSDFTNFTVHPKTEWKMNITAVEGPYGENSTFTVTGLPDSAKNVSFIIDNITYTVNVTDGTASLTLNNLTVGIHNGTVFYAGDENYSAKSPTFRPHITKATPEIALEMVNGNVTAEVSGNATGTVTFYINGKNCTRPIVNGSVTLPGNYLICGDNYVVAIYNGDDNYYAIDTAKSFIIDKNSTYLKVDPVGNHYVGDEFSIYVHGPDATKVTINGIPYDILDDGTVNITTSDLISGHYVVVATFEENSTNLGNVSTVTFDIGKAPAFVNVTVNPIEVGETAVINLTVPEGITGYVMVSVNGTDYLAIITDGNGALNVSKLDSGKYNINVTYIENGKFLSAVNSTTLFVSKVSGIDINASVKNATFGEPVEVTVELPGDATGNVTVVIGDKNVTVPVAGGNNTIYVPGIPVGEHNVTVTYNGDNKYGPATVNATVTVSKVNTTSGGGFIVDDQGNGTVIVYVPGNATGNVTVIIGNNTYNATIINGTAVINLTNVTPGEYNVTVIYSGDENHTNATFNTTIYVSKYATPISIEVYDDYVGNVTRIIVYVPEKVKDNVTIEIDGVVHSVRPVEGVATFDVEGLTAGRKSVTAVYAGDSDYEFNSTTGQFTVFKVNSTVKAETAPIDVGETATISITGPSDYNGLAIVDVNGTKYSVNLTKGIGSVDVAKLTEGEYPITVTYVENDKYLSNSNVTSLTVSKVAGIDINASVKNATFGEPVEVTVELPDDATGNVTVVIGNKNVTVPVSGGNNTIYVPGVPVGEHNVTVTYNGDDKYGPASVNATVTVSKVNTSSAEGGFIVDDLGNGTVIVYVPGNATGNVTIQVGNDTYNATIVNGTAVVNLTNVTPGEYNVTVIYSGDENHTNATFNTTININKYITPISIEVYDDYVGNVTIIIVYVPENVKDNVTIEIDGVVHSVRPVEGVATFDVEGLTAGKKSVTAVYAGDSDYLANSTTGQFTVFKVNSTVKAETAPIDVGETATISITGPSDYNGLAIVDVNGTKYSVNLTKGIGSVDVAKLTEGEYPITVTYVENDKYLSNSNVTSLTVSKVAGIDINASVKNATFGEPVEVTVELPGDATGNVTVVIGNKNVTVPVSGGNNTIYVPGVPVGEHNVTVTYNGDNKYDPATVNATVTVSKVNTTSGGGFVVDDQGNGTVIVYVPVNATGNVTIQVGNDTYNATIVNGTAIINLTNVTPGEYNVTVIYSGDENHTNATFNTTIYISKYAAPISIEVYDDYVGNVTRILVYVPENVKDNVTIEIDGVVHSVKPVEGVATFDVDGLTAGKKSVTAVYAGDSDYEFNSTTAQFTVFKVNSTVKAETAPIDVGETARINVTGPSDYNGLAIVDVNGTKYSVNLTSGVGHVDVAKLTEGEYPITVTYVENDKYLSNTNATELVVFKVSGIDINASVKNATFGEPVEVTVELPGDATGNVTVIIGDKNVTVPVSGGNNTILVPGVPVGEHNVTVTYNGDDKYGPASVNATVTVSKVNTSSAEGGFIVDDLGNGTVIVYVPGNATGNVTIQVGNDTYNATIVNGTAVVNLTNVTPGEYNVTVIYSGDENHTNATFNTTVHVAKYITPISIDVYDDYVGNVTRIIVYVPENVKDNVTIEIDGVVHSVKPVDGVATFDVEGLTAGKKSVAAVYAGDSDYLFNSTTGQFTVFKVNSTVKAETEPINVGETARITVTGPSDYNGLAIVDVNGTKYSVNLTEGAGSVDVAKLAEGKYTITVTYVENDKFLSSTNKTELAVSKVGDTNINASVKNVTYGEPVEVTVELPGDATGNVTVIIGDKNVTVPVSGGNNTIYVPGVPAGDYNLTVTYNGDDKYDPASVNATVTVSKVNTSSAEGGFIVDDLGNGTVIVYVPGNATGSITVKAGNDTYNATIANGTAVIDMTDITPGEHNITVIYSGDENHSNATFNTTVNIGKYFTPISVEVHDDYVGNVTRIIVYVPENVKDNVTIEIDGALYSLRPVDGAAAFDVEGLTAGKKSVTATYAGDSDYEFNSTTGQFTVFKVNSTVKAETAPINVGETARITVTGPSDYNGQASVEVNGIRYYAELENGKGTVNVAGLGEGNYSVKVTYFENGKYLSGTNETELEVSKVSGTSISASVENATVGEPVEVNVELPEDATGTVTVIIENQTVTVPVGGGNNTIYVPGVPVGEHNVTVIYNGDDKYEPATVTDKVTVSPKETTDSDINVVDNGDGTVTVTVPENATGNITVLVDGEKYDAEIVNGSAVVNLTNATPGVHNVTVIYSGDENHTPIIVTRNVTIPKYFTPISIEVADSMVGDTVEVVVSVPEGAKGKITVEINGMTFTSDIKDGKATFKIDNLLSGNKTVVASYDGDSNYTNNATTAEFRVSKHVPEVKVEVTDSTGGKAVIKVTVPEDATGYVIVSLNGMEYGINITAGQDTVTVALESGKYEAKATYLGDEKYLENSDSASFDVSRDDANMNVSADNIGKDSADIHVELPDDATGILTVTVDDKTYTVPAKGGDNVIHATDLKPGKHDVSAVYSGDGKYENDTGKTSFATDKFDPNMNASAQNVVKNTADIVVELPEDATGTITVEVAGKTYKVDAKGGENVIPVSGLAQGINNATIKYSGDGKYAESDKTVSISVSAASIGTMIVVDSKFTRVATDWNAGERGAMFYGTLMDTDGNVLANKTVQIAVNGPIYNVTTDSKGRAGLMVNLAYANVYTYALFFQGDELYNASALASSKLTIVKKVTSIEASGVAFKAKQKTKTVSVTLKTSKNPYDGKLYIKSGKELTLKVAGKTYKAYIDSKGKAKFNIKIAAKGSYVARINFAGDNTYEPSSKSIKITVK